MSSTDALQANTMLGKFLILQQLGKGGMGEVYLAEDTLLHRKVALKTMRPSQAEQPKARKRFLREARTAAAVEHRRIVHINEVGEIDEVVFISMELLSGQSLEDFLELSPIPSLRFTLEVIKQICEGLDAAHNAEPSLIHRDIKPANTWLKSISGNPKLIEVKLLDFGLARAAEGDSISQNVGDVMGTPHYMAPEQWLGREVDARSDLFSVGVMLFEMTTGRKPFIGRAEQISVQSMIEPHPAIRELNPTLPEEVCQFIDDLLAKEKSNRPPSARIAIQRIEQIQRMLPDELTPLVWTTANVSSRRDTKTPSRPKSNSPTPTAVLVPERTWLPLIGMLFFGLLVSAGILLWLKGDPKAIEVTKTDDKLLQQMQEQNQNLLASNEALQKRFLQFQEELTKKPLKTEADLQQERKRETEMADLLKQLADNQKTLVVLQQQLKDKPKKTPQEMEQEKEQANRLQKLEDDRLKMQAELATQKAKNDELAKQLASLPKIPDSVPPKKVVEPRPLDCTKGLTTAAIQKSQKEWADYLGVSVETSVHLGEGIKMEFVLIPPGKFLMGSTLAEVESVLKADLKLKRGSMDDEQPQHVVTLTRPFYLGKYEVTQEEYVQLMGVANPSTFKTEANWKRHPVENVSWNDAKKAWERLGMKNLPKGFMKASLPTEAQWEYACRAGTLTAFHIGDESNGDEANCDGNSPFGTDKKGKSLQKTCPVDSKDYRPNAFGLYHMHGNVWEWCLDGWDERAYKVESRIDPEAKVKSDDRRCLRGGSCNVVAVHCRSASRGRNVADFSSGYRGFRLALLPRD